MQQKDVRMLSISLTISRLKLMLRKVYSLPVSAFKDYVDGTTPSGSAAYENVVSRLTFLYGIPKTVSSVTDVLMSARTQLSVL